jgi:hypothetical protein
MSLRENTVSDEKFDEEPDEAGEVCEIAVVPTSHNEFIAQINEKRHTNHIKPCFRM